MRFLFWQYIVALYNDVPYWVYVLLLILFCLGVFVIAFTNGINRRCRKVAGLLLIEYNILTFCSTVFFRPAYDEPFYNYTPFWSYREIFQGQYNELIAENILNVVVFVPIGLLFKTVFSKIRLWDIVALGLCLSISIEAMQLFFHKGLSELDDVMHNTSGCMIGYGVYLLIRMGYEKYNKRRVAVL